MHDYPADGVIGQLRESVRLIRQNARLDNVPEPQAPAEGAGNAPAIETPLASTIE